MNPGTLASGSRLAHDTSREQGPLALPFRRWCGRPFAFAAERIAMENDDVTFNCGYCGWRDTVPAYRRDDGERIFQEHLKRCWRLHAGKPVEQVARD
jgi:hypothetical protein